MCRSPRNMFGGRFLFFSLTQIRLTCRHWDLSFVRFSYKFVVVWKSVWLVCWHQFCTMNGDCGWFGGAWFGSGFGFAVCAVSCIWDCSLFFFLFFASHIPYSLWIAHDLNTNLINLKASSYLYKCMRCMLATTTMFRNIIT